MWRIIDVICEVSQVKIERMFADLVTVCWSHSEPSFIAGDTIQKYPAIGETRELVSFIFYCYFIMQL